MFGSQQKVPWQWKKFWQGTFNTLVTSAVRDPWLFRCDSRKPERLTEKCRITTSSRHPHPSNPTKVNFFTAHASSWITNSLEQLIFTLFASQPTPAPRTFLSESRVDSRNFDYTPIEHIPAFPSDNFIVFSLFCFSSTEEIPFKTNLMETRRMELENALDFRTLNSHLNPKTPEKLSLLFYRCFSIDQKAKCFHKPQCRSQMVLLNQRRELRGSTTSGWDVKQQAY